MEGYTVVKIMYGTLQAPIMSNRPLPCYRWIDYTQYGADEYVDDSLRKRKWFLFETIEDARKFVFMDCHVVVKAYFNNVDDYSENLADSLIRAERMYLDPFGGFYGKKEWIKRLIETGW